MDSHSTIIIIIRLRRTLLIADVSLCCCCYCWLEQENVNRCRPLAVDKEADERELMGTVLSKWILCHKGASLSPPLGLLLLAHWRHSLLYATPVSVEARFDLEWYEAESKQSIKKLGTRRRRTFFNLLDWPLPIGYVLPPRALAIERWISFSSTSTTPVRVGACLLHPGRPFHRIPFC